VDGTFVITAKEDALVVVGPVFASSRALDPLVGRVTGRASGFRADLGTPDPAEPGGLDEERMVRIELVWDDFETGGRVRDADRGHCCHRSCDGDDASLARRPG
jgi:hypothetical protein